jgi:hypothetical protein
MSDIQVTRNQIARKIAGLAMIVFSLSPSSWAQPFTKADSGWVAIFNGVNFDGLYSRMYTKEVTDIPNKTFTVLDGTIRITQGTGWEQGHIGTDKKYSHYRARVEYKFDGTDGNAGLTYHGDEVPPRMSNNWPRSIECQMQQGNAGRAYSIAMCTFKTRAKSGSYDSTGTVVEVCEKAPCNARDYGASEIRDKKGQWNTMEIIVRGSDSAIHIVNDKAVMKVWDIRAPTSGNDYATLVPYGSGSLALQAEGASITYKNWEIMELPTTGPDRLQRLFLVSPNQGAKLSSGTTTNITWKTLGDTKKVSIYYDLGIGGGWVMAADNVNNTGTFTWTVPTELTQKLRFKVSAAPWVVADSSDGDNSIVAVSAVVARDLQRGKSGNLANTTPRRDPKGRLIGSQILKAFKSIGFWVK